MTTPRPPHVRAVPFSGTSRSMSAIRTPDHLIEGVTLERLGREQNLDRRTSRKRIKRAIDRLREAEKDMP